MTADHDRGLGNLTDQQRKAVECDSDAVMVVAGPGSGKTYAMTLAVERVINGGVYPGNCLVVTFTRLAAKQMRVRLESLGITGVHIGTFHSVCYHLIRRYWKEIGYASEDIQVLDRHEQREMVKETIVLSRNGPSQKAVLDTLDRMSRDWELPADTPDAVTAVIEMYQRALLDANAIDYPMVPYLGVSIAKNERPGWTHVFIDEAQDLDYAQWRLFRHCATQRLFAFGDPDQLLYSWRGADVQLMREQATEWKATIVLMEDNFRSGTEIVARANRVIAHNRHRIAKVIKPAREYEGEVGIFPSGNLADMVTSILSGCEHGENEPTVAILGRTHSCLETATTELHEAGYKPSVIGAREKLLDRGSVRNALALLALPDLPLSPKLAERVMRLHGQNDLDIERVRATCRRKARSFLEGVVERLPALADLYNDCDGSGLIERLQLVLSHMRMNLGQVMSPEDSGGMARIVSEFVRTRPWKERTGDNLLAWINLRDGQDEIVTDAMLQVMTIHACKGLEFDHVIVVGLDDWTLPIKRAHGDEERMEEERRLMFVAMTRARIGLYLAVPDDHPSRFLSEAGFGKANTEAIS